MRAKNAVTLPNVGGHTNSGRFLSNREVTWTLHDTLSNHVSDLFLDDTNEDHALKPVEQVFTVTRIHRDWLMISLGICKIAER
jgi:hypothetical protein